MLLDSALERRNPGSLDRFYSSLEQLDADRMRDSAERLSGHTLPGLPEVFRRFVESRFLADYEDDQGLVRRLDQVMHRARQPQLPRWLVDRLDLFRSWVEPRTDDLLGC